MVVVYVVSGSFEEDLRNCYGQSLATKPVVA